MIDLKLQAFCQDKNDMADDILMTVPRYKNNYKLMNLIENTYDDTLGFQNEDLSGGNPE